MAEGKKYPVPKGFRTLLETLAREVLRSQPSDIYAFSALFFEKLVKIREEVGINPLENPDICEQFKLLLHNEASARNLLHPSSVAAQTYESSKPKDFPDLDLKDPNLSEAALRIQKNFRGFETRKKVFTAHPSFEEHVKHYHENVQHGKGSHHGSAASGSGSESAPRTPEESQAELDAKATKIQAAYRGFQVRRHPSKYGVKPSHHRKSSADHVKAIYGNPDKPNGDTNPPSNFNRSISHDSFRSHPEKAAAKIQAGVRGYLTRKHAKESKRRESDAAVKIQAQFRGFRTRRQMEEQGLISPSSRSSGDRSPRRSMPQTPDFAEHPANLDIHDTHGHFKDEGEAATKIQAQVKGFLTRKEIEKEAHAAEKIQSVYRGYHVRKELGDKEGHGQLHQKDGTSALNGDQNQNPIDHGTDF